MHRRPKPYRKRKPYKRKATWGHKFQFTGQQAHAPLAGVNNLSNFLSILRGKTNA